MQGLIREKKIVAARDRGASGHAATVAAGSTRRDHALFVDIGGAETFRRVHTEFA
jgi:hypothetical protein